MGSSKIIHKEKSLSLSCHAWVCLCATVCNALPRGELWLILTYMRTFLCTPSLSWSCDPYIAFLGGTQTWMTSGLQEWVTVLIKCPRRYLLRLEGSLSLWYVPFTSHYHTTGLFNIKSSLEILLFFYCCLIFFYFNWNGVCRPNWPPTSYITLDELLIWWASSAGITELSPVHAVLGSNPGLYACLARADPPSHMSSSSQSLLICLFLEAFFAPWF